MIDKFVSVYFTQQAYVCLDSLYFLTYLLSLLFYLQQILRACLVCHLQLNIHMYVRAPSGEAFISPLLSVHSTLYYLPETGIAWLVRVPQTRQHFTDFATGIQRIEFQEYRIFHMIILCCVILLARFFICLQLVNFFSMQYSASIWAARAAMLCQKLPHQFSGHTLYMGAKSGLA